MNNIIFFFFYNFAHQSAFIDAVITFFAVYLIYVIIALAIAFVFFYHRNWRNFVLLLGSLGLAKVLAKIFKNIFDTLRPFDIFPQVHSLFPEGGHAFPSGHSTVVFAIAFALFFINKKVGYVFMFLGLLVGLARIAAGVHFPIDILGGFALGTGIAYLVAYFVKKYKIT
jgi:undecaprenyl-diphosphatase